VEGKPVADDQKTGRQVERKPVAIGKKSGGMLTKNRGAWSKKALPALRPQKNQLTMCA
jgi:hypothetical protein